MHTYCINVKEPCNSKWSTRNSRVKNRQYNKEAEDEDIYTNNWHLLLYITEKLTKVESLQFYLILVLRISPKCLIFWRKHWPVAAMLIKRQKWAQWDSKKSQNHRKGKRGVEVVINSLSKRLNMIEQSFRGANVPIKWIPFSHPI